MQTRKGESTSGTCDKKSVWEIEKLIQLASVGMRYEDKLEGASNFSPWREQMGLLLEENGLWEFVEGKVVLLADPTQQTTHFKKDVNTR